MPKTRKTKVKWMQAINCKFLELTEMDQVFCTICKCLVNSEKKSLVVQHLNTKSHKSQIEQNKSEETNDACEPANQSNSNFHKDLCCAMVEANIPWNCLNNSGFRRFLETYLNKPIPDESTIRKGYLNKVYEETLTKIRSKIGNSFIWISVDETTDKTGRMMANFIVGKLDNTTRGESYLFCCKQLEATNYETISRFVNSSILMLWPNGDNHENVLLMVTDAAPYMIKAAKHLKVFFTNLKHLTCLVHGMHRIAEQVRGVFDNVDQFVSAAKKVFRKSPSRLTSYKEIMNMQTLPPRPVITRWGTWINAVIFYADNFFKIKEVLNSFDPNEAKCIKEAQNSLQEENLFQNLLFIRNFFAILPETITQLESKGLRLIDSLDHVENLKQKLEAVPGHFGKIALDKMTDVLTKNTFYNELKKLGSIFKIDDEILQTIDIKKEHWPHFFYAPITSCDVERSFSQYKNILQDKREKLTVENIEKILIIYCNKENI